MKIISLEEAVGTQLAHDITEIRPGEFKSAAFRKGHTVCHDDLCRMQRLGKNHLYVLELAADEIHEKCIRPGSRPIYSIRFLKRTNLLLKK